ncbi:MAG TPA: Nif11-like leader peptide family natural product precursor [Thermoanaerobaculia bacterium]|nr:Nif11-like leader peptide family natural product precursor [Thermoanaerobaculia bacterium]
MTSSTSTPVNRARQFLDRLDRDSVLQDRLQAFSTRTGFDLLRDLTQVAREAGFAFTVDELRSALDAGPATGTGRGAPRDQTARTIPLASPSSSASTA